jgi:hypothetical protein
MTDFKRLALQIGDEIKNNITVEELNRITFKINILTLYADYKDFQTFASDSPFT